MPLRSQMLRARGVETRLADGRRILGPVDLAVLPATLTALVGPSGSGKTTLLQSLSGVVQPTAGAVTLGDVPADERVIDLGYVPQHETLHRHLTVAEALRYSAVLRLDGREDPDRRATEIIAELDLVAQTHTLVKNLSGGERRRAACGLELVGHPRVLLLDEPTSGLDPVLERRLMLLFRRLADEGRAVVVATHATASLDLCDAIGVMSQGELALVRDADEAIARLRAAAGDEPQRAEIARAPSRATEVPAGRRPFGLEFRALARRYATTVLRDRRTLGVLIGQAPLIGLLIVTLFHSGALSRSSGPAANTVQYALLLMTGALWLGITSACREIVKERPIVEREFDVGLRADAYVLAKATVLFALAVVQVVLLSAVVLLLQPPDVDTGSVAEVVGLAVLTAWASVSLGLVVSAVARSVDQAAGVIPLVLMPQLIFAGAVIPLERMPHFAAALSQLTYSRWAYAAMGPGLDINSRFADQPRARAALGFDDTFFAHPPAAGAAALAAFTVAFLSLCTVALLWRPPSGES